MEDKVYLFDTTLRDGQQTTGVNFSVSDKMNISQHLDDLGIDYIEGGWPGANPTDNDFFSRNANFSKSKLTAFGMTRRPGRSADNDPGLNALINSSASCVCIVGKSSSFHVKNALEISEDENIKMISDSIYSIKNKNKEAIFDAEHFFDGFKENKGFAMSCIKAAYDSGARWVVLCDTNGGTLPDEIYNIVSEVVKLIPGQNVGIHAHRCKDAERLALRFCKIAGLKEFSFKFPEIRDLSEVMLIAFPHHLARVKNRGTMLYESIEGFNMHVGKYSEVQSADWVIALNLIEKPLKSKIGLEMQFVTEVEAETIKKVLNTKIEKREEVLLHPSTRMVIKRNYNQLGAIKFDIKEYESPSKEDMQKAYSEELRSGNLNLKKWDVQVERFLERVSFITKNYPDYGITEFNDISKSILYDEICKDASSWKEIRNREVLPILINLFTGEEVNLLNNAVPSTISIGSEKRSYRVDYGDSAPSIRVKLQDLYDVKTHPMVVFGKKLVKVEILAPNGRCVQVTENINGFWDGSYPEIKKELAGRYPKHEWR